MSGVTDGILGSGKSASPTGMGTDPETHSGLLSREPRYTRAKKQLLAGAHPPIAHATGYTATAKPMPTFTARVSYGNQKKGDQIEPIFATRVTMIKLITDRRNKYKFKHALSLASPVGYTLSDLSIEFKDIGKQWKKVGKSWHFVGGEIYLDLKITVYVLDEAKSRPKCLKMIMKHEMMHVADEIAIVSKTLPKTLLKKPSIASDFKSPIPDASFESRIKGGGSGVGSELEQAIQRNVWIYESGRQAGKLHSRHKNHAALIEKCLKAP